MKNSLPIFCTSKETVTYTANIALRYNHPSCPHKVDNSVEAVIISHSRPLQPDLVNLICDPYLKRRNEKPTAYICVLTDNVLGLDQGPVHMSSV